MAGDATGLHVLAASEASGYSWRTVATLGDPGVETDLWIGQACVTASGAYAVVVYAPEQADNMAGQQGVLGRAAVVNLRTGAVKDLGGGFSIAYFDPGCGTGSQAVLTSGGWANDSSNAAMSTTLVVADAATGKVSAPVKVAGQVTSAVPYDGQIAAAGGAGLEQVSMSGATRLLAAAAAVPFRLTPAADGSLGYQVMAGKNVDLWQLAGGRAKKVASAPAGSVELRQIGGRIWLVGPKAARVAGLPVQWQPVDAPGIAQPSTTGTLAVTSAEAATPVKGQKYDPAAAQPAVISTQLLAGQRGTASFKVPTTAAPVAASAGGTAGTTKAVTTALVGPTVSRGAAAPEATATAGSPSTPVSADRTCAIALDDPSIQAYQPDFQQVEWAADQAVQGSLTDTRGPNLYGSGLPSYSPQAMFPLPTVLSGGSLPAQVLLGVLTQESNLQQASVHVIQGQTSNPLSSFNWYGNWTDGETTNTGLVDWSNSDCGYGIGQITSGMCLAPGQNDDDQCSNTQSDLVSTPEEQLAVAVDYQANIAAAATLLIDYWNRLWTLGITPQGPLPTLEDDPNYADYVNQWYMAAWAYNSGIEPGSPDYGNTTGCLPGPDCTDGDGNWGLGYADNPINPAYPPDRPNFATSSTNPTPVAGASYTSAWDMSHPEYWPYQEKVIAWAFDSITLWDYSQGQDVRAFDYAPGNTTVPSYDTFCVPGAGTATTPGNNCDPSVVDTSSGSVNGPDACQLPADSSITDHCWWHYPASWAGAGTTAGCIANANCGLGILTYAAGAAEPATEPIAAQFAQTCASTLPSTAVIVGEGGQSALGCPGRNWTSQGAFTWNFAPDQNGNYSSKIEFDQIGAGFGGHFWFGYAQPSDDPSDTVITGTWNPPSTVSGWTNVQVAIPSYGANTGGAVYQINPGGGQPVQDVTVDQGATSGTNTWVNLGTYDLGAGASVSLSNVTPNVIDITIGNSTAGGDLAWSAAAFVPASGPDYSYTAMGDSYSSGEGNTPYDSPNDGCDRSSEAFGRQFAADNSSIGTAGIQHIACSGATIENLLNTGQNGELPQISQMTPKSKLVTVTIGGNDVGFASVLTYCLLNPTTCESHYNTDNSTNLYTVIDTDLEPDLVDAYEAMQQKAPDAKIVAVTYPLLFQPGTACLGLTVPDVNFLNNMGEYLDNAIISASQAAGIYVMDERYAFLGHQLCSPGSDPWILAPPSPFPAGDSIIDTSAWMHPNAAGHGQIADDLADYWSALQAGTAPKIWPQSVNPNPPTGWQSPNLPYGIPTTEQATAMLAALPRITAYNTTTYNASSFGFPATRNSCTTRNRVLIAQALTSAQNPGAPLTVTSPCTVTGGTWYTPYEATPTQQVCTPTATGCLGTYLPIDHLVPTKMAWQSGAYNWTNAYGAQGTQMLIDFGNDLGGPELLVVSTTTNSSKGANGPESWMPPNTGIACTYAKMWIAVMWEWNVPVNNTTAGTLSANELAALQNALSSDTC